MKKTLGRKDEDAPQDTTSSSATGAKRNALFIGQGDGDVYTFPAKVWNHRTGEITKTNVIATNGCSTCVGIYVPLSRTKCFAAHFDGKMLRADMDRSHAHQYSPLSDAEGVALRELIQTQLENKLANIQAEVQAIRADADLKKKIIIVCPWVMVDGKKTSQYHMIEVLCDFFRLDRKKVNKTIAHGFIVDHVAQQGRYLQWKQPGLTELIFDQICWLADKGSKPLWIANFESVMDTTYDYIMVEDTEFEPCNFIGQGRILPWCFMWHNGVWGGGQRW